MNQSNKNAYTDFSELRKLRNSNEQRKKRLRPNVYFLINILFYFAILGIYFMTSGKRTFLPFSPKVKFQTN